MYLKPHKKVKLKKTAEATVNLIGNKIKNKITQNSLYNDSETSS